MGGSDLLRSDVAVYRPLILTRGRDAEGGWRNAESEKHMLLALIVSLIAIGASVLVGVLGYLIDRSDESAEHRVLEKSRTTRKA